MMGVMLIWGLAYFSVCLCLSVCLSLSFCLLGQEQKVFHTICNSKQSPCPDKTSVDNLTVGPALRLQGPWHQAVGEKGVLVQRAMQIRSIASRRPLLPAPRFYTRLPPLWPPAAGGRAGWLAFPVLGSSIRRLAPWAHLKDAQPSKLVQNWGDGRDWGQ